MTEDSVEEIPGEVFRFHVRSFRNPEVKYFVDLEEHDLIGECNCHHWVMRLGPKVKLGERVRCKHIKVARDVAFDQIGRLLQKSLNKPRFHQR